MLMLLDMATPQISTLNIMIRIEGLNVMYLQVDTPCHPHLTRKWGSLLRISNIVILFRLVLGDNSQKD